MNGWLAHDQLSRNLMLFSCDPIIQLCLSGRGYRSRTVIRFELFTFWKTVVHVVVQFYPGFKFYFPLFLGMVMYDNEFETKENKI